MHRQNQIFFDVKKFPNLGGHKRAHSTSHCSPIPFLFWNDSSFTTACPFVDIPTGFRTAIQREIVYGVQNAQKNFLGYNKTLRIRQKFSKIQVQLSIMGRKKLFGPDCRYLHCSVCVISFLKKLMFNSAVKHTAIRAV